MAKAAIVRVKMATVRAKITTNEYKVTASQLSTAAAFGRPLVVSVVDLRTAACAQKCCRWWRADIARVIGIGEARLS